MPIISVLQNKILPIRREIINLLVFFDLFSYPLTAFEIWRYLDGQYELLELMAILENLSLIVSQKNGFYFLAGRDEIVALRSRRYNYTRRKIKIARRFTRLASLCPFVRSVALANVIGDFNLRDESDIDLFIITSPRRLWLTRLLAAGLAKILGRRPTPNEKKDKLCLSFYISLEHLNLVDLKLPGSGREADPYFYYWQRSLVPLFDRWGTFKRFLAANDLMPLIGEGSKTRKTSSSPRPRRLLNFLEVWARRWQLKIMPLALKEVLHKDEGVIANESVLKLYWPDRRREFLNQFNYKLNALLAKIN